MRMRRGKTLLPLKGAQRMCRALVVAMALVPLSMFWSEAVGQAYEVAEVTHGASLTGTVTFQGLPPAPKVFEVEKDPEVCGSTRALVEVAVHNGLLKEAVIVLEGVERGKPFAARASRGQSPGEGEFRYAPGDELALEIRTKQCSFGPFTGVLAPDAPVRILNEDPIKHTIQTFVVRGRKGNILRTVHNRDIRPGTVFEESFATKKLEKSRVVRIRCNRHDFMQNWFYTVQTPYFAISDEKGRFTIDQVPAGRYELVAWHPLLGIQRQAVTVQAHENLELTFEFSKKPEG